MHCIQALFKHYARSRSAVRATVRAKSTDLVRVLDATVIWLRRIRKNLLLSHQRRAAMSPSYHDDRSRPMMHRESFVRCCYHTEQTQITVRVWDSNQKRYIFFGLQHKLKQCAVVALHRRGIHCCGCLRIDKEILTALCNVFIALMKSMEGIFSRLSW